MAFLDTEAVSLIARLGEKGMTINVKHGDTTGGARSSSDAVPGFPCFQFVS